MQENGITADYDGFKLCFEDIHKLNEVLYGDKTKKTTGLAVDFKATLVEMEWIETLVSNNLPLSPSEIDLMFKTSNQLVAYLVELKQNSIDIYTKVLELYSVKRFLEYSEKMNVQFIGEFHVNLELLEDSNGNQ